MRNNETGEFELVVGNRQLLSGFFIVVLLFAVAFAMGYLVGENSKSAKAQTEIAQNAAPPGTPPDARPQPSSPSTPSASSATIPETPPVRETTPQTKTQPARDVPPPVREVPPPPREEPKPKRESPPREAKTPAAEGKTPEVKTPSEAPAGSYWQVLATANRESAQMMAQSLQDKGLPAILGPGPNNLIRVLVGPYHDTAALGKAKTQLESAGLHPVRK